MTIKHTPEWRLRTGDEMISNNPLPVIVTDSNTAIASMENETGEDWTPEEIQANVRLIAAAPALLAACKFVIGHLDKLESGTASDDPLNRLRRIAHKPLRDVLGPAISQAE